MYFNWIVFKIPKIIERTQMDRKLISAGFVGACTSTAIICTVLGFEHGFTTGTYAGIVLNILAIALNIYSIKRAK